MLRFSASILFALALALSASAQTRPATYAEFNTSIAPDDGTALKAMIDAEAVDYIYLRPGEYTLNNPVTINRTTSLFIHGAEVATTRLVAQDPTQPLFVVTAAPLVNFASVNFYPIWPSSTAPANAVALRTSNTSPTAIEIQDSGLSWSMFDFNGPGRYQLQHNNYNVGGLTQSAVLADDPGADVVILLGNTSNSATLNPSVSDYAHFWQKQGRLRVYGVSMQGSLGDADIKIETRSQLGPHVVASNRSEGADPSLHPDGTNAISRLVQVPATAEHVDIMVKFNGGAWGEIHPTDPNNCVVVDYHAAGTLWLFGNTTTNFCGRRLVEGGPAGSRIVSVGNLINAPSAFNGSSQVFSAADTFRNNVWTGSPTNPTVHWLTGASVHTERLVNMKGVPKVPIDYVPDAIPRPRMTAALPGMTNVKSAPYNAHGDGAFDDTAAIQAALDANCPTAKLLYFPAGTYKISDTLKYNYDGGPCNFDPGGWFVGAGSDVTTIQMATGVKKGVFHSDGLHSAIVQGLTMRSFTWSSGDPEEATFSADSNVAVSFRSQRDGLYDMVLDGGYSAAAFGAGIETAGNNSEMAAFYSTFKNAQIGWNSGNQNALMNSIINGQTLNNVNALGSKTIGDVQAAGGNWHAWHVVSTSTGQDWDPSGAPSGTTWGVYDWISTAPSYMLAGSTSAAFPLSIENSVLNPAAGVTNPFQTGAAQGPFFLYTHVIRAGIKIGQGGMARNDAVKMQSVIEDWGSAVAPSPQSQLEEIDWPDPRPMGRVFVPSTTAQSNCVLGALTGCVL